MNKLVWASAKVAWKHWSIPRSWLREHSSTGEIRTRVIEGHTISGEHRATILYFVEDIFSLMGE